MFKFNKEVNDLKSQINALVDAFIAKAGVVNEGPFDLSTEEGRSAAQRSSRNAEARRRGFRDGNHSAAHMLADGKPIEPALTPEIPLAIDYTTNKVYANGAKPYSTYVDPVTGTKSVVSSDGCTDIDPLTGRVVIK